MSRTAAAFVTQFCSICIEYNDVYTTLKYYSINNNSNHLFFSYKPLNAIISIQSYNDANMYVNYV